VTASSREIVFRLAAVGALAAALFHAAALMSPAIAQLEYEPSYPISRHLAFIAIDGALAGLLLRRPRWLVWAYAPLVVQTLNSHGLGAWRIWVDEHRVDWISVAVSIATPTILWFLVMESRGRRRDARLATRG
jgi:hypothetical protein